MTIHQVAFVLLALSTCCVWSGRKWLWISLSCLTLVVAAAGGMLSPVAIATTLILALLVGYYYTADHGKAHTILLFVAVSVLCVALGVHAFPGFEQWLIVPHLQLSNASPAFPIVYYFDKPLVGIILLGFTCQYLVRSRSDCASMLKSSWLVALSGIGIVYVIGFIVGYIRVDVTFNQVWWIWAAKNLLFVCVAEEAFFRRFLQTELARLIQGNEVEGHRASNEARKRARQIALIAAALLFGIAHIGGGAIYVLLASAAGIVYGLVYYLTNRIEASILTHFALNSIHFLFFSYPFAIET